MGKKDVKEEKCGTDMKDEKKDKKKVQEGHEVQLLQERR